MKNVTMAQIRTDVLDLIDKTSGGRYSTTVLERFINTSRDKLHAIVADGDDDDWLTYCVGVEVKPTVAAGQVIPLPTYGTTAQVDWWVVPEVPQGGDDGWNPNNVGGSVEQLVAAPGVHRLRKVQILESYTSLSSTGERLENISEWTGRARDLERVGLDKLNHDADSKDWTINDPPKYRLIGGNTLWLDRPSSADAGFLIWYVADLLDVATAGNTNLQPGWLDWIVYDVSARLMYRDREFDAAGVFAQERQNLEDMIRAQAASRDEGGVPTIRQTWGGEVGDQDLRDYLTHWGDRG